jgi:hypothetical protein
MEEKQNTIINTPSYGGLKTMDCLVSHDLKDENKMTGNSAASASMSER